jgi:hypothetical protein
MPTSAARERVGAPASSGPPNESRPRAGCARRRVLHWSWFLSLDLGADASGGWRSARILTKPADTQPNSPPQPASTTDLPHRRAPLTVTISELEVRVGIALMQHAA